MKTSFFKTQRLLVLINLVLVFLSFNTDQTKLDLKEKVYAQTDRPLYFPDETIWFKAYVVNTSNTISALSEMMYVDLLSPKGSVVKTLRLAVQNGYSYGSFHIDKDWVGGIYTLKMYTNWMRNYGEDNFFTKEINVQKVVQPNLQMTMKFEREGYGPSSEVSASLEVKDLKNAPYANKEVNMAVMVKGKSYLSKSLRLNEKGKLTAKFKLPEHLDTADVLLNMLIPYKGSTESISRSVPVVLDKLDLQFFPESGKIIGGTKNNIAFKAVNEFGKPADISGTLFDETGNAILHFTSFHDGMGGFEFTPVINGKYYTQITAPFVSDKKIWLPEIHADGVRFSIREENNKVQLSLFSSSKDKLRLTVANETGILLTRPIKPEEKTLSIDTADFPIGIAKFSIVDQRKAVQAERLGFMNGHKQLNVAINIEKETFDTREKVKVNIKTTDEKGKPVPSNLSIGVADNKLLSFADDKQNHIISYLLLSSELKGKIHKPNFYFDKEEPKAKNALDYVMLTHGWRVYIKESKVSLMNAEYQPEQLSIQHGTVVDRKGNPKKAQLLLFDNNDNKVLTFETDEEGQFAFKQSEGQNYTLVAYTDDNTPLYIQSKKRDTGFSSKAESKAGVPNPRTPKDFFGVKKSNQEPIQQEAQANLSLVEDASALDEVIVVGYHVTQKANLSASSSTIDSEQLNSTESIGRLLQGRASGVNIVNGNGVAGNGSKIIIRGLASVSGNSQPLYIVDGIPMGFTEITPDQISSVSVLKGLAATTLYGSRGSNGVIMISTRGYRNDYDRKKKLNNKKHNIYTSRDFYFYGQNRLDTSAKFYTPIYEGEHLPEERTDFRSTIYWNPVVQTNSEGNANFEFYNSDAITSFKITAEGIGANGLLGRQEKDYSAKKMLAIDFKMPSYMAINDILTLPLTITNETDETLFTSLKLDLPQSLKLVTDLERNVNIPPHSTVVKNVGITAVERTNNSNIRVEIKSDTYQDQIHKNVTVLSPYFPIETSFSGLESQTYEFSATDVAPNSLSGEFTVYTDIVGDVMNGVESMMRQPYGCFEQVSSATYPNVLILKYLRQIGKNRKRIERKAKKYISSGYSRMAAYETKENGFEWYGATPPHEALSAYGLLLFEEMKDVYDGVDQKMIERTIKWLMSRRDTKGGFLQNTGKYGFSSAPADVNNAFIVYALTETATKIDLDKEYRSVYFDALDGRDTYKLSLAALSSHNLNKITDYNNLMSYIKLNIRKNGYEGLPVKNTITRSYGNAKNIENTALTLLALMRDFEPNELIITKGIEHLLQKRRYGRFGSTQSTAMALKVLIEYSQRQEKKIISKNDMIELHLNGEVIRKSLATAINGKVKIDSLERYIREGNQTISVKFSNKQVIFPYNFNMKWSSEVPDSSENCKIELKTTIKAGKYKVGDLARMTVSVLNDNEHGLPMATAVIGIPSGASLQPWQLKEILEQKKVAYYEIFDNYLVLYWREFGPKETKVINLDLKSEIAGSYKAPASSVYLYYGDEFKKWIPGNQLTILE